MRKASAYKTSLARCLCTDNTMYGSKCLFSRKQQATILKNVKWSFKNFFFLWWYLHDAINIMVYDMECWKHYETKPTI